MCFVNLEKVFDRVPRRVMQWALRKKGLPEILVKTVMSLYEGSKKKVKIGSEFSEKFDAAVNVNQGSILSLLLLPIVVDFVTVQRRLNKRGFVYG